MFRVCARSHRYPARKVHAQYYTVICGLLGSTMFFYVISQTARFSRKKLLNITCVFQISLQLLSEIFLILRRTERDVINAYWASCNMLVILVIYEWNLNFLDKFLKNTQISYLMKISPVGAELFRADGRTDRQTYTHDVANSRFSQLCEPA
jgi:hypothetical protein